MSNVNSGGDIEKTNYPLIQNFRKYLMHYDVDPKNANSLPELIDLVGTIYQPFPVFLASIKSSLEDVSTGKPNEHASDSGDPSPQDMSVFTRSSLVELSDIGHSIGRGAFSPAVYVNAYSHALYYSYDPYNIAMINSMIAFFDSASSAFGVSKMIESTSPKEIYLCPIKVYGKGAEWCFSENMSLKKIDGLDSIDISDATSLMGMFADCSFLSEGLDEVSQMSSNSVDNISYFCYNCPAIEQIDLSNIYFSGAVDIAYAFANCASLKKLPQMHFDNATSVYAYGCFFGCTGLPNTISVDGHNIGWHKDIVLYSCLIFGTEYSDYTNKYLQYKDYTPNGSWTSINRAIVTNMVTPTMISIRNMSFTAGKSIVTSNDYNTYYSNLWPMYAFDEHCVYPRLRYLHFYNVHASIDADTNYVIIGPYGARQIKEIVRSDGMYRWVYDRIYNSYIFMSSHPNLFDVTYHNVSISVDGGIMGLFIFVSGLKTTDALENFYVTSNGFVQSLTIVGVPFSKELNTINLSGIKMYNFSLFEGAYKQYGVIETLYFDLEKRENEESDIIENSSSVDGMFDVEWINDKPNGLSTVDIRIGLRHLTNVKAHEILPASNRKFIVHAGCQTNSAVVIQNEVKKILSPSVRQYKYSVKDDVDSYDVAFLLLASKSTVQAANVSGYTWNGINVPLYDENWDVLVTVSRTYDLYPSDKGTEVGTYHPWLLKVHETITNCEKVPVLHVKGHNDAYPKLYTITGDLREAYYNKFRETRIGSTFNKTYIVGGRAPRLTDEEMTQINYVNEPEYKMMTSAFTDTAKYYLFGGPRKEESYERSGYLSKDTSSTGAGYSISPEAYGISDADFKSIVLDWAAKRNDDLYLDPYGRGSITFEYSYTSSGIPSDVIEAAENEACSIKQVKINIH